MMILKIICASLFVLSLTFCTVLWYGDPQNGRIYYRFQARMRYWLDMQPHYVKLDPSSNYTGVWTNWYENGMKSQVSYIDGKVSGKLLNWDKNDELLGSSFINVTGKYLNQCWLNDKLVSKIIYVDDKKWYGFFWDNSIDFYCPTNATEYYLDYKKVTKTEYDKWVKESGGLDKILVSHPEIKQ